MASSRKCHVGLCGPCSLCHSKSIKYTHPEKFDDKQYTFLCKVENKLVDKCACICYACLKQLKRNLGNPKFEPQWRTKYNSQSKCSIHNCECQCLNCLNTSTHQENKDLDEEQHHMIVDSQEDSWESDGYVEESDDDLEIDDDDDEVDEIMDRVFGAESDPEET